MKNEIKAFKARHALFVNDTNAAALPLTAFHLESHPSAPFSPLD